MQEFIESVLVPGLASGALFGLVAVAFSVVFATTGVVNFAHGQLVMVLPLGVLVAVGAGIPVWAAYVLGLLLVLVLSLAEERVAIRPFAHSGAALPWILSTLGVSVILAELLAIPYAGESRSYEHGITASSFDLLGIRVSVADLVTIAALVVVVVVISAFYRRTRTGLELRALADDVDGAEAIGISSARASQIAVAIAGGVAAVTGLLVASTQLVSPSLGLSYTFNGFVAMALGGMGSVPGALVGGLLVGVAGQATGLYVGSLFVNLAVFSLLLVVYAVRPHGLFGRPPVREV